MESIHFVGVIKSVHIMDSLYEKTKMCSIMPLKFIVTDRNQK